MRELLGVNLEKLMLGTLVLNTADGLIEQVKSMQYSRSKMNIVYGFHFEGEINGKPTTAYKNLPLTAQLLSALGWKVKNGKNKKVIFAWPPPDQFDDEEEIKSLEVRFVMEDGAIEGYSGGDVIIIGPEANSRPEGWLEMDYFSFLDNYFFQVYAKRMNLKFLTDTFKQQLTIRGEKEPVTIEYCK